MAGPWEEYGQAEVVSEGGPWEAFGAGANSVLEVSGYDATKEWEDQAGDFRGQWENKAADELAKGRETQFFRSLMGGPNAAPSAGEISREEIVARAQELAKEAGYAPTLEGSHNVQIDRDDILNWSPDQMNTPSNFVRAGDELHEVERDKISPVEAAAKGAIDVAQPLAFRAANAVPGVNVDRNEANAAWEDNMTTALADRPMSTRLGQAAGITAGGAGSLTAKATASAPKLVAPQIAAKFAGDQAIKKTARYAGRGAALSAIGAADLAGYNAISESRNVERETGEEVNPIDFAISNLDDPWGYAPLPAASVVSRAIRGGATTLTNSAKASIAARKPKAVAGTFTPKDVQQRVSLADMTGGNTPASGARSRAIELLIKKGVDPDQIEEAVNLYHYAGNGSVDEALFLLAESADAKQLTTALGSVGGDAQEMLREYFQQAKRNSPGILQRYLRRASGLSGDDFYDAKKGFKEQARQELPDMYADAYGKQVSPETWEGQIIPAILDYGDSPSALREAASRAAASGKPGTREAAGELYRLADEIDEIQRLAGEAGFAGNLLPAGGIAELEQSLGREIARPQSLSTQALDQLDRLLGDRSQSILRQNRGAELAGTVTDTQKRIRGNGDAGLDPETGLNAPRDRSAELTNAGKAADFGRKAYKNGTDIETLLDEFADEAARYGDEAAPSETITGALLMGWLRGAEDDIASSPAPATVIRKIYGTQRQREKLLAMMPKLSDEAGAGTKGGNTKRVRALVGGKRSDGREVPSIFDRQRKMLDAEGRIVAGSQTNQRREAVEAQGGLQRFINTAIDVLADMKGAAVKGARATVNRATQPDIFKPDVNRELGDILTTSGRNEIMGVVEELRAAKAAKGSKINKGGNWRTGLAEQEGPTVAGGILGGTLGYAPDAVADDGVGLELSRAQERIHELESQQQALEEGDPVAIQNLLQRRGYDLGPTGADGVIGPNTRKAIAENREAIREELDIARERMAQLEEQAAFERTEAPAWKESLRELGPLGGVIAGAAIGGLTRGRGVKAASRKSGAIAREANERLGSGPVSRSMTSPKGLNNRTAAVNEFWRAGGAGENVPFRTTQSGKIVPRPGPVEPSGLFPEPGRFNGTDVGIIGSGLAESGVSQVAYMEAKSELEAAREAVEKEPNEANRARLERARDQVAIWDTMRRAGLLVAGGRAAGAYKMPYKAPPANIPAAEAERALLLGTIKKGK